MPFDESIREFHLSQIDRRKTCERMNRDSQLMARDLTRIGKNDYALWPLDGIYIT